MSLLLTGAGKHAVASGSPTPGPEATAFLARRTGTPHTDEYTTLINGLVADGVWAKLEIIYILATNVTANAFLNLKSSSFTITVGGTGTFTADQGWAGNGTSGYLNTNFRLGEDGDTTQNDACIGVYNRTSRTSNHDSVVGGITHDNVSMTYLGSLNVGIISCTINDADHVGVANTNSQGAWTGSRLSGTEINIYKNGTSTPFGGAALASVSNASPSIVESLFFGGFHQGGTPGFFLPDQLAAAWYGFGLTGAEAAALHNRINAYLTALGTNVY